MKKALALALTASLVLSSTVVGFANTNPELPKFSGGIYFNEVKEALSLAPIVQEGVTYLPVRELAEKVGLEIHYDAKGHSAYLLDKGYDVNSLPQVERKDNMNLFRNGRQITFSKVIIENDRSYVPANEFVPAIGMYYYEDVLSSSIYLLNDDVASKDGKYVAVGLADARGWTPQVTIEIKDGKIVSADYNEINAQGVGKKQDENYFTNWASRFPGFDPAAAYAQLENELIEKQAPSKVDVATGATRAHESLQKLASKALAQSKIEAVNPATNYAYKNGQYIVYGLTDARGYTPVVHLEVAEGKIVSVHYDEVKEDGTGKRADEAYQERWRTSIDKPQLNQVAAIAEREAQIVKTQDANFVDVISGATRWTDNLKSLAVAALNHARTSDVNVGEGDVIYVFRGAPTAASAYYVQLLAVAKDGEILDIDYTEYRKGEPLTKKDNPSYLERWKTARETEFPGLDQLKVLAEMEALFLETKDADAIDAVSGATNWAKGIKDLGPRAVDFIK